MKKIQCESSFFFFSQGKELYFLKVNSKSSGSCLLVSENEDNQKKQRQIWLVDMQFSSHKYLSGINGKFGGSFLVMFVTFSCGSKSRNYEVLSPKSWLLKEKMKEGP